MIIAFKIFILIGIIKLLPSLKPITAAGIYTVIILVFALFTGTEPSRAIIPGLLTLGLSFIYFWLLKRTDGNAIWWLVLICGVFLLV